MIIIYLTDKKGGKKYIFLFLGIKKFQVQKYFEFNLDFNIRLVETVSAHQK